MRIIYNSDKEKIEEICRANYDRIYNYSLAMTKNVALSQDITQEVFLRVLKNPEKILNHPNQTGYLYRVARNVAFEMQRRLILSSYDQLDSELPDENSDCLDIIERHKSDNLDERAYTENILSLLPEDKRKLYEERYVQGKSIKEIADEHGIDETAMRMRFMRIRKFIREIISKMDF